MWTVRRNFGRNVVFSPSRVYAPRTEEEVLDILRRHRGQPIRCMGSGHSWSRILATQGVLVDLSYFNRVQPIGTRPHERVQVGAGCTLGLLLEQLRPLGLTLPTLGAVLRQTVAGAVSTGTHGSGAPSLSHHVDGVRVATYDPRTREPTVRTIHDGDELRAARCALGSLGIILRLAVRVEPEYLVEERQENIGPAQPAFGEEWPLEQFALFPWSWNWLAFRRRRTSLPLRPVRAFLRRVLLWLMADFGLHLLLKLQLARARRSGDQVIRRFFRKLRAPEHHRVDRSRAVLTLDHARFRHVEMEVFVPERHFATAMHAIRGFIELGGGEDTDRARETAGALAADEILALRGRWTHHYPISCRRVWPDDTLVSMASGGAEPWIAISLFTYALPVTEGFDSFARLAAAWLVKHCEARLHWGKYFPMGFREAAKAYPEFARFEDICRRYDPARAFWSENL